MNIRYSKKTKAMSSVDYLGTLESDDSDGDASNPQLTAEGPSLDYDCSALKNNDYVVVKFKTKKKVIHYIGQIISEAGDLMVKYLKREKMSSFNFICRNAELYQFIKEDIVCKVPDPIQHGGTARINVPPSPLLVPSSSSLACLTVGKPALGGRMVEFNPPKDLRKPSCQEMSFNKTPHESLGHYSAILLTGILLTSQTCFSRTSAPKCAIGTSPRERFLYS
ncbi:hypothetical protein HELRODRAFT_161188 [Helobdella robusta]|uniref:Uncharacterized protein n=1 Tax=Helobdella robusta TaxID=6412 RepID=T1ER72_HELRO|nr:hypothetical protein HELRODRAFT_161188 [Helobdella robusta]ESO01976.1 hypothetical protein HELRODRAFT_161188 [Helobdella robusta]